MSIVSRRIDIDGVNTHYLESGGEGPTVVLVHGGGAGADAEGNWHELIPLLKGYRVLAIDMPGFGRSACPDPKQDYSQEARDRHLGQFIMAVARVPAVLVGNSMGGLTALGVAREQPGSVAKLVLMGSAGLPVPMSAALRTIMDYDFTSEGMARIVRALTAPGYSPPEGMVEYRHKLSIEPLIRSAYQQITAWNKARGGLHQDESRFSCIKTPTLVVGGKNDQVVPVSCAYRFLELLDNSTGYIMPHCGHWPMIERPRDFAAILRLFVES